VSSVDLDFKLEPMTLNDLRGVIENEKLSYSHPWSEGIFADCVKSGNECWVFVVGSQNIGHGILSVGAGEAHLLNVCINPEHQGQGYGRALVLHMLSRARELRSASIFLEVRPSNLVAYKLYESLGFSEIGIREGYYPATGGREDAIVFARNLDD